MCFVVFLPQDVAKDSAQHYRKAKKFYDGIALELVAHGHSFSIFSCALDQVRVGTTVGPYRSRMCLSACCQSACTAEREG